MFFDGGKKKYLTFFCEGVSSLSTLIDPAG